MSQNATSQTLFAYHLAKHFFQRLIALGRDQRRGIRALQLHHIGPAAVRFHLSDHGDIDDVGLVAT